MHEQSHRNRLLTQPEAAGLVTVPANVCAARVELWGCFFREATDEQTARLCLQPALD